MLHRQSWECLENIVNKVGQLERKSMVLGLDAGYWLIKLSNKRLFIDLNVLIKNAYTLARLTKNLRETLIMVDNVAQNYAMGEGAFMSK